MSNQGLAAGPLRSVSRSVHTSSSPASSRDWKRLCRASLASCRWVLQGKPAARLTLDIPPAGQPEIIVAVVQQSSTTLACYRCGWFLGLHSTTTNLALDWLGGRFHQASLKRRAGTATLTRQSRPRFREAYGLSASCMNGRGQNADSQSSRVNCWRPPSKGNVGLGNTVDFSWRTPLEVP